MTFLSFFSKTTLNACVQIGLAENEQCYCLVYLQENKPVIFWHNKPCQINEIIKALPLAIQNRKIIRPIPYHYIWRKYLIQPITTDKATLFRQIIQTIKQELPIAIEDVYFDYKISPLADQNLQRVIIYALRKSFADPLLLGNNTILDCELHCWQRAIHFLTEKKNQSFKNYAFKDKVIEFKFNELTIHQEISTETATLANLNLPDNLVNPELYLLALGAALWD